MEPHLCTGTVSGWVAAINDISNQSNLSMARTPSERWHLRRPWLESCNAVRLPVCRAREIVVILLTRGLSRVDCAAVMHPNTHIPHYIARTAALRACSIGYRAERDATACASRSCVFGWDRIVSD